MNKIKNFIKEHKKELLLLLITLIICFIILEVFVRVYYFSPLALLPSYGGHLIHIGRAGIIQESDNCGIVYELKPNLDTYFRLTEFKTNSVGLRDKEYSLEKPNNTYRVVVLGDSLTMPSGVDIDLAYHSILEDEFNNESNGGGMNYEFINFAVGGYNLDQYLTVLENKSLGYNPDHVLVGICLVNDIPMKKLGSSTSERYSKCNYQVESTVNTYIFPMSLFVIYSKIQTFINQRNQEEMEFDIEHFDYLMEEFKNVSEENNINITFIALRWTDNEEKEQFEMLKNATDKYDFNLIDTVDEFEGDTKHYWIYRFDHHPNWEANQLFAKAIKEHINL